MLFGVVVLGLVVVLLLFYYTAVHTPHLEVAVFQVYVYPEVTWHYSWVRVAGSFSLQSVPSRTQIC